MNFSRKKSKIDEAFVEEQGKKMNENDLSEVLENEKNIDKKLANSSMLEKYTELGKLMLNMLKDYRKGIYKQVPWFTIATIVFSLLYVLNPFDIVPDFVPGLGYIDDLSVITFGMRFIESDLHKYLDWKLEK